MLYVSFSFNISTLICINFSTNLILFVYINLYYIILRKISKLGSMEIIVEIMVFQKLESINIYRLESYSVKPFHFPCFLVERIGIILLKCNTIGEIVCQTFCLFWVVKTPTTLPTTTKVHCFGSWFAKKLVFLKTQRYQVYSLLILIVKLIKTVI